MSRKPKPRRINKHKRVPLNTPLKAKQAKWRQDKEEACGNLGRKSLLSSCATVNDNKPVENVG